ncbi:hypothetical protein D3C77_519030 [compost metagenome]
MLFIERRGIEYRFFVMLFQQIERLLNHKQSEAVILIEWFIPRIQLFEMLVDFFLVFVLHFVIRIVHRCVARCYPIFLILFTFDLPTNLLHRSPCLEQLVANNVAIMV